MVPLFSIDGYAELLEYREPASRAHCIRVSALRRAQLGTQKDMSAIPLRRPAAILLAAGRGSRMLERSGALPKCMLTLPDGRRILDVLLNQVLPTTQEIIVVTGHGHDEVNAYLQEHYPDSAIRCVLNDQYAADTNIFSVDLGIHAVQHDKHGYLIIETDLVVSDDSWAKIFSELQNDKSFWVCNGYYGPNLTGGIVHVTAKGDIDAVAYQPDYDPRFEGWAKMVGMLYVAPAEVSEHRRLSRLVMENGYRQYYMAPWVQHLAHLPCRVLQLDGQFTATFNTAEEFDRAVAQYTARSSQRSSPTCQ